MPVVAAVGAPPSTRIWASDVASAPQLVEEPETSVQFFMSKVPPAEAAKEAIPVRSVPKPKKAQLSNLFQRSIAEAAAAERTSVVAELDHH